MVNNYYIYCRIPIFLIRLVIIVIGETPQEVISDYNAKTEAASKAYWTPERIAQKEARKAKFHKDMENAYEKLPKFFQDWVFKNEKGMYERDSIIEIAKDAYLVATTLKTPEAIIEWFILDHDIEIKKVPGISDNHSGVAFLQVARLACYYLESENKKTNKKF